MTLVGFEPTTFRLAFRGANHGVRWGGGGGGLRVGGWGGAWGVGGGTGVGCVDTSCP